MADSHATETELAWAAGLFEGEGCILADEKAPRGRPRVRLYLSSTDLDVVKRFQRILGVGSIRPHSRPEPQYKDLWAWQISGKAVEAPLRALLPWLAERRTARALAALKLIPSIGVENRLKTHCPKGHPYDAVNTRWKDGARSCRECNRQACRARRNKVALNR